MGLTREACALLSNGSPASKQLGYHLSSHAELLSAKAEPPLVWFSVSIFSHQRLHESLRFEMLEIQQHLETFPDRKYHATEVSNNFEMRRLYLSTISNLITVSGSSKSNDETSGIRW